MPSRRYLRAEAVGGADSITAAADGVVSGADELVPADDERRAGRIRLHLEARRIALVDPKQRDALDARNRMHDRTQLAVGDGAAEGPSLRVALERPAERVDVPVQRAPDLVLDAQRVGEPLDPGIDGDLDAAQPYRLHVDRRAQHAPLFQVCADLRQ